MKSKKMIMIVAACLIAVIAAAAGGFWIYQENQKKTAVTSAKDAEEREAQASDDLDINTVVYQGQEYKRRDNIETILFMGVDKKNQEMVDEIPANGGQSDCMILLVMDTETKVTQMIQISRESMVDVAIYDENGTYMRSQNAQICLQYAFGDGKKRSCWLAENLVSALFYNMPIDAYAALNVEGISAITTAMGGVDLTIPQDYSSIDPSFVQGTQVNLQGDLAVKYVQYRDITEAGSNNGRMERQNHFLRAMASQVKAKYGSGNAYESLLDVADPYMVTDLSVDQIEQLGSYSLADEILKVPGETVTGEEHDEYHIDMDGLYELVLDVFYDPVADETEPA